MVDRITPRTTADDSRGRAGGHRPRRTGRRSPPSPSREWVLSGDLPRRPAAWERAGATFTDDITPFEHRKLWLLNGGHSLLAYAGSAPRASDRRRGRGRRDLPRSWLQQWWSEASPHLTSPTEERGRLPGRAAGPVRQPADPPPARPDRRRRVAEAAGADPADAAARNAPQVGCPTGAVRVLAAWLCTLRGHGAPVKDARADEIVPLADGPLPDAARKVLGVLDPAVAADDELVAAVIAAADELVTS